MSEAIGRPAEIPAKGVALDIPRTGSHDHRVVCGGRGQWVTKSPRPAESADRGYQSKTRTKFSFQAASWAKPVKLNLNTVLAKPICNFGLCEQGELTFS